MPSSTHDVSEIVEEWLLLHGFDGLYNELGECGCGFGDFAPCGCLSGDCEAAYRYRCNRCAKADECEIWDRSYDSVPYETYSPVGSLCEPDYRKERCSDGE